MAEEREAEQYEYRVVCSKHRPERADDLDTAQRMIAGTETFECAPRIQRRIVPEWEDI